MTQSGSNAARTLKQALGLYKIPRTSERLPVCESPQDRLLNVLTLYPVPGRMRWDWNRRYNLAGSLKQMNEERKFQARIELFGTRCFIPLPFDPNEAWGAKERHHLTGTVAGHKYRGAVDRFGDRFGLPTGAAFLRDTGLQPGSEVEVILKPEGPQSGALAPDITNALQAEPAAAQFFDALPTFYRKNYMRWVDSAKRPETRAKRIREMVQLLREEKREK